MRHGIRCALAAILAIVFVGCSSTDPATDTPVHVRKNVKDLTAQERADFVQAIKAMKTVPSPYDASMNYYDQFVYWHLKAFYCTGDGDGHMEGMYPAHMAPTFLPWHRVFLDMFEGALRDVSGKPITIPYWDWTDPASVSSVFTDDFMGGSGDPAHGYAVMTGPFRKDSFLLRIYDVDDIDSIFVDVDTDPNPVPYLVRAFGVFKDSTVHLPSATEIAATLAIPTYDSAPWNSAVDTAVSFRNALEGWRGTAGEECDDGLMDVIPTPQRRSQQHNVVHIWTGGIVTTGGSVIAGTMAQATSPNDPVFWLHHANIDRLWSAWMARHGRVYLPASGAPHGRNLYDVMPPFQIRTDGRNTPASVLDEAVLNYRYDVVP